MMKPQIPVLLVLFGASLAWGLWQAARRLTPLFGKQADLRRREEELVTLSARLSAASSKAMEELDRRKRELAELISLCDERLAELRRQSAGRKVVHLMPALGPVPAPAPAPAAFHRRVPESDVSARHRLICELADQGWDLAEVARRTMAARSEVQLVLALREADRELAAAAGPVTTAGELAAGPGRRTALKGGVRS